MCATNPKDAVSLLLSHNSLALLEQLWKAASMQLLYSLLGLLAISSISCIRLRKTWGFDDTWLLASCRFCLVLSKVRKEF